MKTIITVILVCAFIIPLSPKFGVLLLILYFVSKYFKRKKNAAIVVDSKVSIVESKTETAILKCAKCGSDLKITDKVCASCGEPFDGNNVKVQVSNVIDEINKPKVFVKQSDFDPMYALPDDLLLLNFVKKEMVKADIKDIDKLIPSSLLKRKKIFNIIFSVLLFIYVVLIFFHFPIMTYIIGFIILFVFFKKTRNLSFEKYIVREVKSRPGEKILNIIMSNKESLMPDKSRIVFIVGSVMAICLGLLLFIKPVILYEKDENWNGYAVRFYAFGLTNFTTATIPETHNNKPVVSLRGNTFSNMPFLKEAKLPNTIYEIRGQAFKNDRSLKKVNMPTNLNYLGGGAFYNCESLENIEFPDTLTYLGGESFTNAKSLKYVKLSNNLAEIRGNTFENCTKLAEISIPDSVTRIGGHAFYNNSSLSKVDISSNSKLNEIGSSAFRKCDNLNSIILPRNIYVNSRAFKESPTIVHFYDETNNYYR